MESKNIVGMILAVTVGLICIGTVLMPMLSEATTTEETFTNEGYFRMTHYDTTSPHTLTWSYESPDVVVVDDVEVPIEYDVANGGVTIVADTNFIIRYYTDSTGNPSSVSFVGSSSGAKTATVANSHSVSFDFTAGTCTANFGGSNVFTATYEDLYLPSLDGVFTMKKYDVDAYLNADSDLVAYGITPVAYSGGIMGNPGAGFSFTGSYEDGITASVWRHPDNVSVSDVSLNITEQSQYVDLYTLQSITATATYTETVGDETVTTDTALTYTYLLVPYEVTSELSAHFDTTQIAILMVTPVLMIIAVLLVAVRGLTRYD